jgi:hypothetical protein
VRRLVALGAAISALLVAKICLLLAPGSAVRFATRVNAPRDPRPVNPIRLCDLCWAITAAAARPPFSATCLEQGIALVTLLAMLRIPAHLVVGVSREESTLRAHAWVECGGVVVLGGAQSHGFAPLLHAPASSRPSGVSASCPG